MRYKGFVASSSDASGETLSSTVQGIIVVLSAVVPMVAMQFFHVQVSANDISTLVTEIASLVGVILMIRGLIMKIVNRTLTV